MNTYYRLATFLLVLLTVSCGTRKKLVRSTKEKSPSERVEEKVVSQKETPARKSGNESGKEAAPTSYVDKVDRYIATYAPIAKEEMELYKIPASITLAQGILESGAGEGELTRKANNHFGIKCHGWEGGSVFHDDDRPQECFRKYDDAKYSFRDHSLFLTQRKRYAGLFDLEIDDYKGWARGLKAAGYATDRRYPDKLISIIERYQLYKYDAEVLGTERIAQNGQHAGNEKYVVKQGDTLYSIAKRYNLSVEQLKRYNNLRGTTIGVGQVLNITP